MADTMTATETKTDYCICGHERREHAYIQPFECQHPACRSKANKNKWGEPAPLCQRYTPSPFQAKAAPGR